MVVVLEFNQLGFPECSSSSSKAGGNIRQGKDWDRIRQMDEHIVRQTFLEIYRIIGLLGSTYPLHGYILGVLTHTTAWNLHWGGNEILE